jgi:hypothetical protein
MENIKYTSDGKKVVVIGKLNSNETIVQEIFVTKDGHELPGGENFVVRVLLDEPAKSWLETEMIKIKNNYNNTTSKYSKELEELERNYREKNTLLRAKLEAVGKTLKNVSEESFNTIIDYLTGNIKYVVLYSKYDVELLEYNELDWTDNYNHKGLKLLSLFGKDNGTLNYKLCEYTDGSGISRNIELFNNYEEAFNSFKTRLLNVSSLNEEHIKQFQKYNIEIPKDLLEEYKERRVVYCKQELERLYNVIESYTNTIKEIEKL